MDIKKINEEMRKILEQSDDELEWVYEEICEIEPISMDELEKKDIITWEGQVDIDKAVDELHKYYQQGKLSVGIPTNTAFTYQGQTYQLALVIGNAVQQGNKLYCKFSYKHIFYKHGKETKIVNGGSLAKEEDLKNAIKDIENAIEHGKPFVSSKYPDRLVILYNSFLYVIVYSNQQGYVTYLHTLFPVTQKYVKNTLTKKMIPTTALKINQQKTT